MFSFVTRSVLPFSSSAEHGLPVVGRQQNTAYPLWGGSRTQITLCVATAEHGLAFVWRQQNTAYPLWGGSRPQITLCVATAEPRWPFGWRQQNTAYQLWGGSRTQITLCVATAEHGLAFVWRQQNTAYPLCGDTEHSLPSVWRQQNTAYPLCGGSRTQLTLCVTTADHDLPFVWRQQNTTYPLCDDTDHSLPFVWRQQNTDNPLCGGIKHSLPFVWRCPFAQDQRHVSLYLHSVVALFGQVQHSDAVQHQAYDTHNSSFTLTPCERKSKQKCIWWLFPHIPGSFRSKIGSLHTTGVYCGKDTAFSTLLGSTAERTRWKDTAVSTVGRFQYCGDFYVHPPVNRTHNALALFQVAGITCIQSHAVIVSESHTEY